MDKITSKIHEIADYLDIIPINDDIQRTDEEMLDLCLKKIKEIKALKMSFPIAHLKDKNMQVLSYIEGTNKAIMFIPQGDYFAKEFNNGDKLLALYNDKKELSLDNLKPLNEDKDGLFIFEVFNNG